MTYMGKEPKKKKRIDIFIRIIDSLFCRAEANT